MQFHQIRLRFPDFGINKIQETIRLIYEISKREKTNLENIINAIPSRDFEYVKKELIKRRFPYSSVHNEAIRPYLPTLKLNPSLLFNANNSKFNPIKIFVEKATASNYLKNRFKTFFPKAKFTEIESLKKYLHDNKISEKSNPSHKSPGFSPKYKCKLFSAREEASDFSLRGSTYNNRRDTVFISNEKYDFFKKCPCTKGAVRCGYVIFNLGFGCIFDCAYCYLQEYTNTPGLIFPGNIDKFFEEFKHYRTPNIRIGTGEFSDSLMLDHITEYSVPIISFFNKQRNAIFEFKTKSSNINNILKAKHSGNIIVSWSLNPQKIIDKNEFFTASLNKRLVSAVKCIDAGYRVGFHFDPVIYFKGWEQEYAHLIDLLFSKIPCKNIAWISIGTFRFKPELKPIIENRFPDNTILDEELFLGYDNKLRYPYSLRYSIYKFLLGIFKKYSKKLPIYLCMEEFSMWQDIKSTYRMDNWLTL